ncbi:MAG TPA: hypothetical protein VMX38_07390 [Verrucomicrobiae bacterium]|jgi:hypothetical protein|nr:hypothetical protein [Verrucomicrobiae bacterium]
MSSAVVSTSAAARRLFVFDADSSTEVCSPSAPKKPAAIQPSSRETITRAVQSTIKNQKSAIPLAPASQLEIRPLPEMVSSGIPEIDALTGGLPRGCITEICGPASSGRTTLLLAALAAATHRGEFCAVIDSSNALDPHSAASAGVDLDYLLWVRCANSPAKPKDCEKQKNRISTNAQEATNLEQALHATDLLLESGGFGLIVLDLADVPSSIAHRIPLTTWFRFRRAIEHTPTIFLAIGQQPIAGSCSSLLLQLRPGEMESRDNQLSHTELLTGMNIHAQLARSRLDRKPAQSITFESKTAWAG